MDTSGVVSRDHKISGPSGVSTSDIFRIVGTPGHTGVGLPTVRATPRLDGGGTTGGRGLTISRVSGPVDARSTQTPVGSVGVSATPKGRVPEQDLLLSLPQSI